ncbi:hypothetical protein AVEN_195932-1 [Araneus ventricosus]|uniref:DDE-1 domain-containing protein n=1 Tax=Araneus ventricosus TaxID=182803 RepID=A0A4Y2V801_ARAVE|nr:hypothetical protein AVEN_195932-1 [Araneus ventricosus]
MHKNLDIYTIKESKRVRIVAKKHLKNSAILAFISNIAIAISPLVLFKCERITPERKDTLPTGLVYEITPRSSMKASTFWKLVTHMHKFKSHWPRFLIFDGAKCHCDYSIAFKWQKKIKSLFIAFPLTLPRTSVNGQ